MKTLNISILVCPLYSMCYTMTCFVSSKFDDAAIQGNGLPYMDERLALQTIIP